MLPRMTALGDTFLHQKTAAIVSMDSYLTLVKESCHERRQSH
jgi:hypothetical protein